MGDGASLFRTRDEIVKTLANEIVEVIFVKANGEERNMLCTLSDHFLPEGTPSKTTKDVNPELVTVWDLEKEGWRSFRLDRLISYEVVE